MAAPSKTKVSLTLLIDTKSRKVLFAEADKHFVDFLFNLLSLPVGTVIKLLTKQSMVGSLGSLYDSIENLSDTYLQPNQNKDSILNPKAALINNVQVPFMLTGGNVTVEKEFYMCPCYHRNVANDAQAVCPQCRQSMDRAVPYVERVLPAKAGAEEGGFVKGVVTYMVMDDLVVKPMSTISSITLLNKFNVKDVGGLEEKVVDLGMDEGLKLLKTSLQSKTVLTNVFLGSKA